MRKIIQPCGFHCIKINDLGVTLGNRVILHDVNLHIHCKTITAIIGRNGAGKSTLVKALLDEVSHTGTIRFRNTKNETMSKLNIGYVPQTINIEPSTPMDVYDLIASYRYSFPVFLQNKKIRQEITDALGEFDAKELIQKPVGTLSGGELQRVLLSMAIMDEPNLLLLDEPVSGMDTNGTEVFYEKIRYLKENYDMSVVVISHDLEYVLQYADHVILLDKTILKEGSAKEVFASKEFAEVFPDFQRRME